MTVRTIAPLLLGLLLLAGCSTNPQGRKQLTAPAPITQVYSDIDMRLRLATVADTACLGEDCASHHAFNLRVQRLGTELARTAFDAYPELAQRISGFEFVVTDKDSPGTASNAKGTIVIFRGVHNLGLDDDALRFLIAREMGHVICQHHDETSSAKILVSVLAGVLFPALNLFRGSAVATQASTATSTTTMSTAMATTAASTATSYLGSQMVVASIKPTQLTEADHTALDLLIETGWDSEHTLAALERCTDMEDGNPWLMDLRQSVSIIRASTLPTIAANPASDASELPPLIAHDAELKEQPVTFVVDAPAQVPEATPKEATPILVAETMPAEPANTPPMSTATPSEETRRPETPVIHLATAADKPPKTTSKVKALPISRKKPPTRKAGIANGPYQTKKIGKMHKTSRKAVHKKPAGHQSRRVTQTTKKLKESR